MKRAIVFGFLAMITLAVLLPGCAIPEVVTGSGSIVTREYDFTGFTGVEVGNAFEVEIIPGDEYSIEITTYENLFKYIEVYKSGDNLKIGLKGFFINIRSPMRATIIMPEMRRLVLSGATDGMAYGFESSGDFTLQLSGASSLDMDIEAAGDADLELSGASTLRGSLEAADVRMELSGASSLELAGSGENAVIRVSGASRTELSGFALRDISAYYSGASHGDLYLTGSLDANLSGASSLTYGGGGQVRDINVSGASGISNR